MNTLSKNDSITTLFTYFNRPFDLQQQDVEDTFYIPKTLSLKFRFRLLFYFYL